TQPEALGQPLIDAVGVAAVDAGHDAEPDRGFAHVIDRLDHARDVALQRDAQPQPHRGRQIVRADEAGVDARDAQNLVDTPDRVDVLDLENEEDLVVGMAVVLAGHGVETERVAAAADDAVSQRVVAGRLDRPLGFLAALDHRYDDAPGPGVEHALEPHRVVPRDAQHWGQWASLPRP